MGRLTMGRPVVRKVRNVLLSKGAVDVLVLEADAGRLGPCELDVAYGNGGVSSTLSHPFLAYEPRAMGLYSDWGLHAARIRSRLMTE